MVTYDLNAAARDQARAGGAEAATSIAGVVDLLKPPRAVWLMVPSGEAVEKTLEILLPLLAKDDVVVDGGNSNYKDTMRRGGMAARQGVAYVDAGTSGGIWGLEQGYCLMIGGSPEPVNRLRPIFETLAPARDRGWAHVGPSGAGHFVKMVHNGIEYGMLQAYAEGYEILHAKEEFGLDLAKIGSRWRTMSGSPPIIRQ